MHEQITTLIKLAVAEDLGEGDHSSSACIPADARGEVQMLAKEAGVLAGSTIAREVMQTIDPGLEWELLIEEGSRIQPGDVIMTISGNKRSILQAERLILNFMQRMSGIATQTAVYADKIADLKTQVLDTRKTTPGLRIFEKHAVLAGGGQNHRMGLYDMIMLKDNHIDFAGGIRQAIEKTQAYLKNTGKKIPVEIEVRNFEELRQVLETGGVNRIMLDNFTTEATRRAVKMIAGRYETESSGGITLETLRDYAECGVDYISAGALTHQIKSLDISLKAV